MGRRENWADTIAHRTPQRLILDLGGCPLAGLSMPQEKLMAALGIEGVPQHAPGRIDERILTALDIDTRGVGTLFSPRSGLEKRISDSENIDCWGVRRRFTGLYWDIVNAPLADATVADLDAYAWPDPESIDQRELDEYGRLARYLYEETDYIICGEHPVFGVFELGCWMCGFENFLVRLHTEPEFIHRFFEIILNFQKRVIERYYNAIGRCIHFTSSGDDFATQTSLFLSPEMFAEFVQPYFTQRIAYTKQFTDALFLHHSCGNVYRLIPLLKECGVEMLNPIQPCCDQMDPKKLKADYGDGLIFHGGLDTQAVLPFGKPEQVKAAVTALADVMAVGGGYVFAAAHNIQEDVTGENVVALFEAARAWRKP